MASGSGMMMDKTSGNMPPSGQAMMGGGMGKMPSKGMMMDTGSQRGKKLPPRRTVGFRRKAPYSSLMK